MSEKLESTPTIGQVVKTLLAALSTRSARNAWRTLAKEGCEPDTLIWHVFSCIRPNAQLNQTLVDGSAEFRDHRKRVKNLSRKMRLVAKEYWGLKQEPSFGGVITDVNHVGPPLEVLLEYQAECLEVTVAGYLKRKSRCFLTEDLPLAALSAYVLRKTRRRHYPEIATLLAGWSGLCGKGKEFFPDSLSKKVRRFEQKFGKQAFEGPAT